MKSVKSVALVWLRFCRAVKQHNGSYIINLKTFTNRMEVSRVISIEPCVRKDGKKVRILAVLPLLVCVVLALTISTGARQMGGKSGPRFIGDQRVSLGGKVDEPCPARVTWIRGGDLARVTVDNVGLIGLYEAPVDWDGTYDGSWPENVTNWNGYCAEYPAGSRQFYLFSSGIWIGAKCLYIVDDDTIGVEPRVATGAYDPDMSTMSPLYLSTQIIPPGEEGAGDLLFVPPGGEPAPYQRLWEYADTASINPRRRAYFGTDKYDLDPARGDMVSQQDSWAVYGDWIPEEEGYFLYPAYGYDTRPLGIRVEQRTYSSTYGPEMNYIFLDYKIKNMNDFPLDSLYVGYFMDADIGNECIIPEGCPDDLIGFDRSRNLGYAYDSNGEEPGWTTPAGYIGTLFLKTPGDLRMTGFQTWTREDPEGDVDRNGRDDLKYMQLVGNYDGHGHATPDDPDTAIFEITVEPSYVRYLMASGPYQSLAPGEEVEVAIAMIAGHALNELQTNADMALTLYNRGYWIGESFILRVKASPSQAEPGGEVQITAYVWDPDGILSVYASFENPDEVPIDSIALYDDGSHNDGAAGDHIYGNSWTTGSVGMAYLVDITAKDNLLNKSTFNNAATFTTLGPVVCVGYRITGEDTIPNPGDILHLKIRLKNEGQNIVRQVKANIRSYYLVFGDLAAGETVESQNDYELWIPEDSPDGTIIKRGLTITDSASVVSCWRDSFAITVQSGIVKFEDENPIPKVFSLSQNYPNPFNPSTSIMFSLPRVSNVKLAIYNLLGQKVASLCDEKLRAGTYSVVWNADGFPSGVYFCEIKAGKFSQTRRMILLK